MKKQEIISILTELHKITGFRVSLHAPDYTEIAAYPEHIYGFCKEIQASPEEYCRCVECDKEACRRALEIGSTHIYKCRYGFTEAVSPLYNFGTLTGFLMMGQVYENPASKEKQIRALRKLGIADAEAKRITDESPAVNPTMVSSYVKIMTICAQYITLSNALPGDNPTPPQIAKRYIYDHIGEKLGIRDICREIGCSKSTLMAAFKREFGTTVNAFITDARLEEAIKMLTAGEKSIGEISQATGFSDQSYFSKVFSIKYGIPPSEYVKRMRSKEDSK